MAPQLAKLAKTHGDKVVVLQVNVQRYGQMAQEAGVRSIPDTRLFHGGRQLERKVGGMRFEQLEKMVLANAGQLPPVVPDAGRELVAKRPTGPKLPGGIVRQAPALTPEQEEARKNSIVPMKKDWLPPGVTAE